MGFISGMVTGTIVGIALVAGWSRMMANRSAKRIGKAADIKLMGSLTREDLKKICGDNYREWISFPVFEQVKWLNKQLSKMWPFIADAASLVIKESVEPLLEDYRPTGVSSLKFSKLFLGHVPPKIEGIRVQNLKEGQITMDIDLRWGGDPSIILAVEALVASLPIQPKPKIDYTLKAVGGSLSAIPGLSDMIVDTVNTIVSDMLQWPHRIVVPLGGVSVDTSDLELKPQGRLTVTVMSANSLKNKEMIGKSDPYVVLYVRPLFKLKTKVIDNNLNPEWNETFELIAEDKETQSVAFEVFDKDIGQDKRLGVVKLPLIDLDAGISKEIDLPLLSSLDTLKVRDKKDRGSLKIKVLYHEFSKEEQDKALEDEKRILEERKQMKEAGLIGSSMEALDGAAGLVGSGIGMVGSGFEAVGSGLSKAGKFMGKSFTGQFGSTRKNGGTSTAVVGNNGSG